MITLTWQSLITISAILSAVGIIIGCVVKAVNWFNLQNNHDESINNLSTKHDEDIDSIKSEQRLIIEGLLACLQGLQEKGCNGPVTNAIVKIDKYLNEKAHE